MLDLGATVCTARPLRSCPARPSCTWNAAGPPEPDPAAARRAIRRQSRFEGSDRQGRGRLVDALRRNESLAPRGSSLAGCGTTIMNRARRVAETLVDDGLAVRRTDGSLALPD